MPRYKKYSTSGIEPTTLITFNMVCHGLSQNTQTHQLNSYRDVIMGKPYDEICDNLAVKMIYEPWGSFSNLQISESFLCYSMIWQANKPRGKGKGDNYMIWQANNPNLGLLAERSTVYIQFPPKVHFISQRLHYFGLCRRDRYDVCLLETRQSLRRAIGEMAICWNCLTLGFIC